MEKAIELDFLKRLKKQGRIKLWERTPITHRKNERSILYILVSNRQKDNIWLPLDYCVSERFTNEEIAAMKGML